MLFKAACCGTEASLAGHHYHGVHNEAAGDDLHRVQYVAEGLARRHLQGQLQGGSETVAVSFPQLNGGIF